MYNPPLAGWLGGKSRLREAIVARIPAHTCYAEVFAGAAWVLFSKEPSKAEVVNDINGDVVNLYRVLQHHLDEFVRYFRWVLPSRAEFVRLLEQPPELLTDIQRAARYYYLQKMGFGGQGKHFAATPTSPPRLNLLRIEEELSAAHLRLARVTVERMPFQEMIERYDRQETFFYLDPPYWGCEKDYGPDVFCRQNFQDLADQLAQIQGKFLLSLNDVPEVRETFGAFLQEPVATTYTCAKDSTTEAAELFSSPTTSHATSAKWSC